jgi:tetratricopeptide (TPR) repeat protein
VEALKRAASDKPDEAQTLLALGHAYLATNRYAEAETEYQAAIALNPDNSDYYNRLAINYPEWDKPKKAIEPYWRAADLKPHHVLYYSLGNTYQKLGRLDEAQAAYRKAVEIKPTFTHALYEQGSISFRQGNYPAAVESLRRVLQAEPNHVYALHALGMAYAMTGDKTAAMQQYYILKDLNADIAADLLPQSRNDGGCSVSSLSGRPPGGGEGLHRFCYATSIGLAAVC